MRQRRLATLMMGHVPFYYGWVILACVCAAGFARQGSAVATLSIFVEPMTGEFAWSRTALSGAVSLGGVLAAVTSPLIGPLLDRHGARVMLGAAVLVTGLCTMALSTIHSLAAFYVFFCIARLNFAGPFELGIYGALNSWFVARRPFVTSIANLAQMAGLVAMPLIAHVALQQDGWRSAWIAIGATVLIVGFVPNWLLMVRRPEDVGLVPDRRAPEPMAQAASAGAPSAAPAPPLPEPAFTRAQALRTPAFWLLSLYTIAVYPVQAGVSLHQAPYLIEKGLSPAVAATVVSTFSLMSALSSLAYGMFARRTGIRAALALASLSLCISALLMIGIATPVQGYVAACFFGIGIGGVLTMLPLAWADYFGRQSYGAIRGVALTVQVTAQASGPLLSGFLRDITGNYFASLATFAALSAAGILVGLLARAPAPPARSGG